MLEAIPIGNLFWHIFGDDPYFKDYDPLEPFVGLIGARSQVDLVSNKLIPKDVYVYDIWYTILNDDVSPLCWDADEWDLYIKKMRLVTRDRGHQGGKLQMGSAGEIFWVEQVRIDEILRSLKDPDLPHEEINSDVCIEDFVAKLEASWASAEARRLAAPAEALARARTLMTKLLVDQFNCLLTNLCNE